MDRTEAWIVVVPLFAIAAVFAAYKLYLAYAGRSTRGTHTNFDPAMSVEKLAKRVEKDWAREDLAK